MTRRALTMIALLARKPGLLVLRDALISHPQIELGAVFTHGRLPRDEGGGQRTELEHFQSACLTHGIPLHVVDGSDARDIAGRLPAGPLDLLLSLSWRYIVPTHVLHRFTMGAINVHRGALPHYAGARPVQRALEDGQLRVAITAHDMVEEVDAGRVVAEVWIDVPQSALDAREPADRAEDVKSMLEPLYAPLVSLALESRLASE